jgi:beta-lactamase regulating signal transducer with metallopeptidase domain
MNIETLNQWGGNFLDFAWPMLWQSSLLIIVLFAFDFLFRRRLRVSIRYALWLVVLVKLVLPPTLALPTSPAWWLNKFASEVQAKPQLPKYTVTYDQSPLLEISQNVLPVFTPPKPQMVFVAWLFVLSISISVALFAWLLVRWWQIALQARRANVSERLIAIAEQMGKIIGKKFNVPVKLTANTMSPAVCGLLRPVILIPRSLAENFSDQQLRAVLLHEFIHLRRRDVWVNFLQSLLQIFYWWHPLVWLANARIRRVREEAVDDAVMLALREDAETYAPTLVEVAKLALNRPLASLCLVGILESRSALRQRIERLVNFTAPRKAGLTLVSFLGILVFSAVAVPMGGAPSLTDQQILSVPAISAATTLTQNTNPPLVLIQAEIYRIREVDFEKIVSDLNADQTKENNAENFRRITDYLKSSGFQPIQRSRIQTSSGMPAQFYVGNETNSIEFDCKPFVTNGLIELVNHFQTILTSATTTTTNQFDNKVTVENYGGVLISGKNPDGLTESNVVVVTIGAEIVTNTPTRFAERLNSNVNRVGDTNDTSSWTSAKIPGILADTNFQTALRALQQRTGVEKLNEPEVVTTLPGRGINKLDPNALAVMQRKMTFAQFSVKNTNSPPPQIHIKARFLEVPKETLNSLTKMMATINQPVQSAGPVRILSNQNFQTVLQALENRSDVEELAEPEVVTISGRRAIMRATQVITVITNAVYNDAAGTNKSSMTFPSSQIEFGPVFNVVPNILTNGYTLDLRMTASETKFVGYADIPTNMLTHWITNSMGEPIGVPNIWPAAEIGYKSAHVNLYDNQTLVLSSIQFEQIRFGLPDEKREKAVADMILSDRKRFHKEDEELLVFVTVTVIDPAGNRIHSDADIPFSQNVIPPQSVLAN